MKEKAIYFSFPSWHEKKLKCIPLSEYTDEVHVENIAGEEILELIMQLYKVSNMLHLTGLTGFWINNNEIQKELLFFEPWKERYHQ